MRTRVMQLLLLAGFSLPASGGVSQAAAPELQAEAALQPARVIRYRSSLPAYQGQTCYGLVLADANGIPIQVRVLSDHYPVLCYEGESPHPQQFLLRLAFASAAREAGAEAGDVDEMLSELLPQESLAEVVLPPVAISQAEFDSLQRFVIGVGLNYAEHSAEVGVDKPAQELLVFPKPVEPTGAYAPLRAGVQIADLPVRPVLLLDYEVELGLVLLEDIDLRKPPASYEAFIEQVAFFTANDVSDREPIIRDEDAGYTRGKSHPTYLPIGPWMVHGSQLQPRTQGEGDDSLEIGLTVQEARPAEDLPFGEARQLSTTDAMLRGPWAIVRYLAETFQRGTVLCMRDANGHPRYVHTADGVIPAGSIILTGTPGGTAVQEPRMLEKAELFLRGGFSVDGARRKFIEDAEQNVGDTPYLQVGDRVESWVEHLGRQRWSVVPDTEAKPYGIEVMESCPPDARPQPLPQPRL
jgi:2-keto-4-pentenoate hydratase/2-oxohepta-3-ene-1,7-dioic acid hydratase in catechol pathway